MKIKKFLSYLRPKIVGTVVVSVVLVAVIIQAIGNDNNYNASMPQMAEQNSLAGGSTNKSMMSDSFDGGIMERQTTDNFVTKNKQVEQAPMQEVQIVNPEDNLKIIKTANVVLEVVDFDGVFTAIRNLTTNNSGYVESSNSYIYESHPDKKEYLKKGTIRIRVPKEKYEYVKTQVGNTGKIISTSEGTENVTERYIETESRIKTIEVEQERLLEIMKKATKVEELIQLESRLSQLRADLESYKSQIQNWDKLVAFSTINIDLTQVRSEEMIQPVDKNLMQRVTESFVASINNVKTSIEELLVWFAGNIINLIISIIIYGTVIVVIIVGMKKVVKKIKK